MTLFLLSRRYVWLLLSLVASNIYAQEIKFHKLIEENVFDKQSVLSIAQDSKGILWFAGGDNIFKYNSGRVTDIRYQDTSWSDLGYITRLAITDQDKLFIVSSSGLYTYCSEQANLTLIAKRFTDFTMQDVHDIQSFDSHLFISTKKGLYQIGTEDTTYHISPIIKDKIIFTVQKKEGNNYFLASPDGILTLNLDSKQQPKISLLFQIPQLINMNDVITTLSHHEGQIWIGSKRHGLFHYNIQTSQFQNYNEKNSNLLSNNIRKIITDSYGNIWIGTLKGLSLYRGGLPFQNHYHDTSTPYSLSQNSIYDIYIDQQEILWIGTYFGGLNMIYPPSIDIEVFSTKSNAPHRLSSDIVRGFTETDKGYWIGTDENGINFLDKKSHHIKMHPAYTRSNLIKDIYQRNNKIYVAQYGGGYSIIDTQNGTSQHSLLKQDTADVANNVYSIYTDKDETLYLGTNTGLYTVNNTSTTTSLIPSIPRSVIGKIASNTTGDIYALAGQDLYVKIKNNKSFEPLNISRSFKINDFYIDQDDLWLITVDKVYKYTKSTSVDSILEWKDGQLKSIVKIEDKLWITSQNGLIHHDLITQYTNLLTLEDGLPTNNLGNARLYVDSSKNIFITTQDGLVKLSSQKILFNMVAPQIYLNNIFVSNNKLSRERIVTDKTTQEITVHLKYDENFLAMDFSNSNLIKPYTNHYTYKLEGYDKDWTVSKYPTVQYSNLPIGEHVLTVFASNNDMVWTDKPLTVKLIIHPPFYLTWWAYIIYTLIVVIAIHFIIKFIVEREVLITTEREYEKKIHFFTQISHEIRTPLTLIAMPLDEIIAETANQSNVQQKAKRMKKNASKLLNIVNELLDFRKFDEKKQQLKKTQVSLSAYIEDIFYLLSDLANRKNLNYYINRMDNPDLFPIDQIEFDKVMFNLLSNAIKYTPQNGTVYLDLINTEKFVEIRIVDNGIGVAEQNQFEIFEEYYRQDNTDDVIGTGIGLALTKKIIEQHGGNISCESLIENEQKWTVFRILFEKQESNDNIETIAPALMESKPLMPLYEIMKPKNESTVLVVEDNKELLDILVDIFQGDYCVITAQNGEEGLQQAKAHMPDIILSDMMMPKMSGMELCHSIKTDMITSHIPFILLTALKNSDVHTETLQQGANLYLTKPFDKKQLYLSVRNLLAIGKERRKDFKIKKSKIDNAVDQKFLCSLDQLIEEHLTDDNFGVSFIARSMGMSAPILYRKLRAITDLSLNNYVKTYKLNKAKELLNSHMNISEVAYAVGFSDRKYFSKEFKKLFGINPSEYEPEK